MPEERSERGVGYHDLPEGWTVATVCLDASNSTKTGRHGELRGLMAENTRETIIEAAKRVAADSGVSPTKTDFVRLSGSGERSS